jgi:pimeloyl-ACP methyl ester carboxylesterase
VRFVGAVQTDAIVDPCVFERGAELAQEITFCRTSDGVNLAMSAVGDGPPLVKAANWLNHLEYDWQSPIWSPILRRLAARFRLIRYDGRGNGLADREVADISFAAFCRDLETIVAALDLPRFVLLGLSQGAAIAVAYAVAHPDRVSRLILYGGYPQGRNRRGSVEDAAAAQTVLGMMRQGWGHADSAFMRAFASLYLPNGSPEQIRWFAEMQKLTTSGEMAARLRTACDDIDVVELLPRLRVPTLVLHARDDHVVPVAQSRMLAAMIPGARFATLPSENHVPLPDEPACQLLLQEIEGFAASP